MFLKFLNIKFSVWMISSFWRDFFSILEKTLLSTTVIYPILRTVCYFFICLVFYCDKRLLRLLKEMLGMWVLDFVRTMRENDDPLMFKINYIVKQNPCFSWIENTHWLPFHLPELNFENMGQYSFAACERTAWELKALFECWISKLSSRQVFFKISYSTLRDHAARI